MSYRYEIRISGSGGQGLLLMGKVLAEAAAIYENKNVTQSQSYGPEARGGASRSELVISDEDIFCPKAVDLDLLMAFTQEACNAYYQDVKPKGILLLDSSLVTNPPAGNFQKYEISFTNIARDTLKNSSLANILALGSIQELSNIFTAKSVESALIARVPRGVEEINLKALKAGIEIARELKAQHLEK